MKKQELLNHIKNNKNYTLTFKTNKYILNCQDEDIDVYFKIIQPKNSKQNTFNILIGNLYYMVPLRLISIDYLEELIKAAIYIKRRINHIELKYFNFKELDFSKRRNLLEK